MLIGETDTNGHIDRLIRFSFYSPPLSSRYYRGVRFGSLRQLDNDRREHRAVDRMLVNDHFNNGIMRRRGWVSADVN